MILSQHFRAILGFKNIIELRERGKNSGIVWLRSQIYEKILLCCQRTASLFLARLGNHITPQCLSVLCVLPAVYDLIEVFIVVGYTNEILGIVAMLSNTQTLKSHCLLRVMLTLMSETFFVVLHFFNVCSPGLFSLV